MTEKNKGGRPTNHQKRYKNVGRPRIMTAEVIAKLEQAFTQGFNITHACGLAEISQNSYYDYIQENPDFSKKVEWLRSKPYIRTILGINKLINSEDPTTLRWYAERKGKEEFSLRTESTGKDGQPIETKLEIEVRFVD